MGKYFGESDEDHKARINELLADMMEHSKLHPWEVDLIELSAGKELPGGRTEEVKKHIEECEECRKKFKLYVKIREQDLAEEEQDKQFFLASINWDKNP